MCMKAKLLAVMMTLMILSASFVVCADSLSDFDDFCGDLSEPVDDDDVVILSKRIVSGEDLVDEVDAVVGDIVRFNVRIVYNDSDGAGVGKAYKIKDIVVTDTLPSGLEYAGGATLEETSVSDDGVVVWDLGDVELRHMESFSLEFDVRVVTSGTLVNLVSVKALEKCVTIVRSVDDSATVIAKGGNGSLDVEIVKPAEGFWYFYNLKLIPTISGVTRITGPVTIMVDVSGNGEIVKVEYYINDELKWVDYNGKEVSAGDDGSFSWTWLLKPVEPSKDYNIRVDVSTDDGVYSDEIDVMRVRPHVLLYGALFAGALSVLKALMDRSQNKSDGDGGQSDEKIPVPVARIVGGPFVGFVGEPIEFDASESQGVGLSFEWNFDDGKHAYVEKTSHVYTSPGNYSVTLRVVDSEGNSSDVAVQVTVKAEPEKEGEDDEKSVIDEYLFWYIVTALALLLLAIIALLFVGGKLYE